MIRLGAVGDRPRSACPLNKGKIPVINAGADFYRDVEVPSHGSVAISHGPPGGRIALKAAGDRLLVAVQGEPAGDCLTKSFREGLDKGVLQPNMRVLVDLTQFTGAVDWGAVFQVRTMAPWGKNSDPGASRIAYVVRNKMFGPLIKIASVLFYRSRHRAFDARADAIAWLESPPRG